MMCGRGVIAVALVLGLVLGCSSSGEKGKNSAKDDRPKSSEKKE
jgi:hypothetical protein